MKSVLVPRRLRIVFLTVFLIFGTICVRATENPTQTASLPDSNDPEEFSSWLRSETDLAAFFETDRQIDGAYATGYAGRLREFYEQDRRLFISTLAACSADAQHRATQLLPSGYAGLQEIQPFYDEILLLMKDTTLTEKELEVLQKIEVSAKHILGMFLPDPTTQPPAANAEDSVPNETTQDPTEGTTLPLQGSEEGTDLGLYWGIGIAALAVVALGIFAMTKAKKR